MANTEFQKAIDDLKKHVAGTSITVKLAKDLRSAHIRKVTEIEAWIRSSDIQKYTAKLQETISERENAVAELHETISAQGSAFSDLQGMLTSFDAQRDLLKQISAVHSFSATASTLEALRSLQAGTPESFKEFIKLQSSLSPVKILEAARIDLLGAKNGKIREAQRSLGLVEKADKPEAGKLFNQMKKQVEESLALTQKEVASVVGKEVSEPFDVTLPGQTVRIGHLHPISQTIREMKDIMGRLGFSAVEGPEIEDDWHNFEALNIPLSHPARDPLDNFYLGDPTSSPGEPASAGGKAAAPLLLRSQTSTVQIRVMEQCVAATAVGEAPPPVRIISLGRVYRPDTADATHYPMFHQIEGLLIDRGVTMADLKSVLRLFCQSYFGDDNSAEDEVHVRFRPSFFPFTEPSVEVDMNWQDAQGNNRWMEMGGAGMVDPNVLRAVGYDPEVVTGFAFGLGVERICMRQHGITDIRALYQNDVRFLSQF